MDLRGCGDIAREPADRAHGLAGTLRAGLLNRDPEVRSSSPTIGSGVGNGFCTDGAGTVGRSDTRNMTQRPSAPSPRQQQQKHSLKHGQSIMLTGESAAKPL